MKKKMMCLAMAFAMVISITACGAKEESVADSKADSVVSEENVSEEASSDDAKTSTDAAETPKEGLKVALLLSGASNDQGWCQSAYEGCEKACEKYGCELSYSENLEMADIAAAYADYASNGYDIIVGHGFEFGDPALEVADTYPDVKFIVTEADVEAENVASYVMACEQTAYVEGIIAAITSESGKVGAIGPIQGDSLVKIINGFEDGAKSVDPDIEVQTAWTNSFVDTQLAQEAAQAMIDNGADVIKHCANACGNGALAAAVDANIWCQGDSYDQSSLAPDNILDSAIYNLDVVLDLAIGDVVNGTFEGAVENLGMAEGAVEVLMSDNMTAEAKSAAEDAIEKIKSGELEVVRDYTIR